ncbi:hypothetical protein [Glaesserella parasuis]|uniref:hypothetical protein n=1 Tax=Glaesserella parasuis TaxID=738 RepID=UPI003CF9982F
MSSKQKRLLLQTRIEHTSRKGYRIQSITNVWGTDYFCIERKKKIWAEKMRWGFVWWGLPHFLLGGVMQKVKWAKMVENGQFLQHFLHRFGQV